MITERLRLPRIKVASGTDLRPTTSDEWGITSLFDQQNKAYELSVLWQRSLHTKEPNHNGSKLSFSFQLVIFPGVAGPDYMGTDPSSAESRLLTISTDELSRELFLLGNISKSSGQQEEEETYP